MTHQGVCFTDLQDLLFLWQFFEDESEEWKSYDDEICILLNICQRRYEDQVEAEEVDNELLENLRFVQISSVVIIDLKEMKQESEGKVFKKVQRTQSSMRKRGLQQMYEREQVIDRKRFV